MSDKANECQKLLDNGWVIRLFKNDLGTYTAAADRFGEDNSGDEIDFDSDVPIDEMPLLDRCITDDFTPAKALYRLTEKVLLGRIVDSSEEP